MSEFSAVTVNPIRSMWERHQPKGNKNKSEIHLQPGDPTLSGKIQIKNFLKDEIKGGTIGFKILFINN